MGSNNNHHHHHPAVQTLIKMMGPTIIRQRQAVLLLAGGNAVVGPSAIVYCTTRTDCEILAEQLNVALKKAVGWCAGAIAVEPYHAGLSQQKRVDTQNRWTSGSTIVVCATIAFGMGIDKSNVRFVFGMAAKPGGVPSGEWSRGT